MRKLIVQISLMMMVIFGQSAKADGPPSPIEGFYCTPTDVTVFFGSRLHIKCTGAMTTGYYENTYIYFFSISTNDYDELDHALKIATTAISSGKRIKLYVRTSSSYNPSGCSASNCRKIAGIGLLK